MNFCPAALAPVLLLSLLAPAAFAVNVNNNGGALHYDTTNQHWTPGSILTNNSGTATFTADSGSESSQPLSIITNGGTVTFASTQHLNALAINGGLTSLTTGTLKTNALTFNTANGTYTGTLDLTSRPLVVETTTNKSAEVATLQSALAAGQSTSTGILSSTLTPTMTIALVDNAVFGQTTFRGFSVDASSLLVVPALLGDATLDGTVDLNDLNIVLNHLGDTDPNYTDGNFDNAPTIDLNDLNTVLNNLGTSISTAVELSLTPAVRPAPEPASLLLAAPLLLLMIRRPRANR